MEAVYTSHANSEQSDKKTSDFSLVTDGERLYGNLLFEICAKVLRTDKPEHLKKILPQGIKVSIKNKGSQGFKKDPKRPKYQDPQSEHPQTRQNLNNKEIHANHIEAFNASLRLRCAAYYRKTNTSAKQENRLQERLDVYWIVHNFIRLHFTTRTVPAVALGILERGVTWKELFSIRKIA